MYIVYGDSRNCFICAVLKDILKKTKIDYRFYELDEDFTIDELIELYPNFKIVPFILHNGTEISLPEFEKIILQV